MTEIDIAEKVELGGIYNIPGEGFVVELQLADTAYLFDKQGLQHRIIEKNRKGLDAKVEEVALAQINNLGPVFDQW
jgi:hypothetical protein